jgi:probable O-glycosylation ligase (exosortase A-associated)
MGLLFTYLMTYGGSVAALFNPFVGLLIYIAFAILRPESLWHWSVPAGNYSRIIAIALLAGWVLNGCGSWNFGRARPIVLTLIAYWVWSIISAVALASNKQVAFGFVEEFSKIALPFVVGATVIDSVSKLRALAWVIVLCQGYVAFDMNRSYFSGFNYLADYGFATMDNNCFAVALDTCVGAAFFLGLNAPRWWMKAAGLGAAALMAHAVLFSFSRGAMLGLIIVGAVAFFLTPKSPKHYVILVLGLLLGIRMAGPEVQKRFFSSFAEQEQRDESAQSRLDLWRDCLDSMMNDPLGLGPEHWPLVAARYGWPAGKHAHTLWLQIGAELGFPGLLLLFSLYTRTVTRLWSLRKDSADRDPWLADAARMVIAALVGFIIAAQFVSLPGLEVPYYIVLLGVATLRLGSTPGTGEPQSDTSEQAEEPPDEEAAPAAAACA